MPETHNYRRLINTTLGAGVLASALAASSVHAPSRDETMHVGPQPVTVIDIAPEQPVAGITQTEFPNNNALMMKILWQNLKKWALQQNNSTPQQGPTATPKKSSNSLAQVKDAIEHGVLGSYKNHGVIVAQTLIQVAHCHGADGAVDMLPLQNLIDPADVESVVDREGNEGIAFTIHAKPVIDALQKRKYPPRVVNMSFMMGQNKLFRLAGNNNFRIESAYSDAHAVENIQEFFAVANAFPDTLFISAAGNNGENLAVLREQIGESWSPNTIFVAEWANGTPASGIIGADLYVDSIAFGAGPSSSLAAPVISAIADRYMDQGHSALQARNLVFKNASSTTYYSLGCQVSVPVLSGIVHR